MARRPQLNITIESNIPQVLTLTEAAINRKLVAMANVSRQKMLMEVLVGNRSGHTYKLPKSQKTYQASAPGEAPASRLGDLRRSYKIGKVEGQGLEKHIKFGSNLDYAEYLEGGTMRKSDRRQRRMRPRPHLKPAMELSKPDHEAILRGDWGI